MGCGWNVPHWQQVTTNLRKLKFLPKHYTKDFVLGTWQCDEYKEFFLQLPVHIQLARGLMASSLALGGISLLLAIPGLHCTRIYENDDFGSSLKSKILFICGVMILIQGILVRETPLRYSFFQRSQHVVQSVTMLTWSLLTITIGTLCRILLIISFMDTPFTLVGYQWE